MTGVWDAAAGVGVMRLVGWIGWMDGWMDWMGGRTDCREGEVRLSMLFVHIDPDIEVSCSPGRPAPHGAGMEVAPSAPTARAVSQAQELAAVWHTSQTNEQYPQPGQELNAGRPRVTVRACVRAIEDDAAVDD